MDSPSTVYDVIVVGAGIEGSSTAYQLAKRGKRVLLLEQFPLPHSRGSSHGQSRVTRQAYREKDFYTVMMKDAYVLMTELEKEAGEQFFIKCGLLMFGDDVLVNASESSMKRQGVSHERLDIHEMKRSYPNFTVSDKYKFILDHTAGVLRADKILNAYQTLFKKNGGVLRDGEPMLDLQPGDIVTVTTNKGVYKGSSVVLTLGPWASKFLPRIGISVPLKSHRISVCYWKETNAGEFDIGKFPTFIQYNASGNYHIYGLPALEYPGLVKVCLHHGPVIDPDNRDSESDRWAIDRLRPFVSKLFPTLQKDPCIVETCIYTNTPDIDFILDVHPAWNNVVVGAGFSGHGFKLAPVVGKILADLSTGHKPSYDMRPFVISRFFKNKL